MNDDLVMLIPVLGLWALLECWWLLRAGRAYRGVMHAELDSRTGLLTPRSMELVVQPDLRLAAAGSVTTAICRIDLRGAGVDQAMAQVERVRRRHEHAIRIDEFRVMLMLWGATSEAIRIAVKRMLGAIMSVSPDVQVRVGIAQAPGDGFDVHELLLVAATNELPGEVWQHLETEDLDAMGFGQQVVRSALDRAIEAIRIDVDHGPAAAGIAWALSGVVVLGARVAGVAIDAQLYMGAAMLAVLVVCAGWAAASLRRAPLAIVLAAGAALLAASALGGTSAWIALPRSVGAALVGVALGRALYVRLWWVASALLVMACVDVWSVYSSSGITNQLTSGASGSDGSVLSTILMVSAVPAADGSAFAIGFADVATIGMIATTQLLWNLRLGPTLGAMMAAVVITLLLADSLHQLIPALPCIAAAYIIVNAPALWNDLRASFPAAASDV